MNNKQVHQQIVNDCTLISFYETKIDKPVLLLPSQSVSVSKYFPKETQPLDYDSPFSEEYSDIQYGIREFKLSDVKTNLVEYIFLTDIISFGNGKLSLCGISAKDTLSGYRVRTFNFYFHDCNKSEVTDILRTITNYMEDEMLIKRNVEKNNVYTIVEHTGEFTFNFVLDIYFNKECLLQSIEDDRYKLGWNKECLLQSIEDDRYKLGWNICSGFYCTVVTGLLVSIEGTDYPMNISDYEDIPKPDIITILYRRFSYFLSANINKDVKYIIFLKWLNVVVIGARNKLIN